MHHQFTPKEIHRFWSKVDMSGGPNSCWEWQGSRDADGYGRFTSNRSKRLGFGPKSWVASRAAWLIHTGHLPGDLLVCHHCDNPPCVNPAHLFLGTNNDNMRDMNRKGRHPRKAAWNPSGETNPRAKMTDEQVIEARRRFAEGGISKSQLGREYGVSSTMMSWVILGRFWSHLPSVDDLRKRRPHH